MRGSTGQGCTAVWLNGARTGVRLPAELHVTGVALRFAGAGLNGLGGRARRVRWEASQRLILWAAAAGAIHSPPTALKATGVVFCLAGASLGGAGGRSGRSSRWAVDGQGSAACSKGRTKRGDSQKLGESSCFYFSKRCFCVPAFSAEDGISLLGRQRGWLPR